MKTNLFVIVSVCIIALSWGRTLDFEPPANPSNASENNQSFFFGICRRFLRLIPTFSLSEVVTFVLQNSYHVKSINVAECNGSCSSTAPPTTMPTTPSTTPMPTTPSTTPMYNYTTPVTTDPTKPEVCQIKNDLIIVLDSSQSIQPHDFRISLEFASRLSRAWKGYDRNRLAVFEFSSKVHTVFGLAQWPLLDVDQASNLIESAPHLHESTYTNKALKACLEEFRNNPINKKIPQIVLIITDGISTWPQQTIAAAQALHKAGIRVYAVKVGSFDSSELLAVINYIPGNLFQVNQFSKLLDVLLEVSQSICMP